ncbi:hypothetical protein GCM10017044_08390 [Kordiimonas sediminis]|uniref:SPOR domain-containing protein n=1 Tax=Kordiimonas sediminis TaxID=1735581 RepID=A0A919E3N6_9PROT|nr:hypothetical protein [Kordiimonas sediminis]GHF16427.1 hypothetical protein GCM10017044_08390 [Kordiimonas sediminis]
MISRFVPSLSLGFLLSACAVFGGGDGGNTSPVTSAAAAGLAPIPRESFCQADDRLEDIASAYEEALSSTSAPEQVFYTALFLERAGHPVRARSLYAGLLQQEAGPSVDVTCGDTVWARGPVAAEAARRLAHLAAELHNMGVRRESAPALHAGLPSNARPEAKVRMPDVGKSGGQAKAVAPRAQPSRLKNGNQSAVGRQSASADIQVPQTVSADGVWFAHLASYKTAENAVRYRGELAETYPALAGHIVEWIAASSTGSVWRLGVRTTEWQDADRLCIAIRSSGAYCRVIDSR